MLAQRFVATQGVPIVTNGLILWLDAGDTKSYPGSGSNTTWYDLSSNAKNATLSGGPAYTNTTNQGYFDFDGAAHYANFASALASSPTAGSFFMWIYPESDGIMLAIVGQSTINTSYHHSAIEINSSALLQMNLWHGNLTSPVSTTISFNTWYNVGVTYASGTLTGYVNGVSIGTSSFTWSAPSSLHLGIAATDGTNMGTSAYGDGRVASVLVYNRALSAAEVARNYNARKRRFGL